MFVTSRGYRIRYQVFGAGSPVVLLHGHPMWSDRWIATGYVDRLQDHYRVIVPDLLGHGQSQKPHDPSAYGNPNIASDVLAILEAEDVGAAHLWGYSWGSMIAEYLAAHSPSRVLSVILGGWPVGLDAAQREAMEAPSADLPATIEENFADWPRQLAELYIANNDFAAMMALHDTLYKFPTTIADLQATQRPTLAYYGAEDTYLELALQQAQALPCHLETVPGNHFAAFGQADNILPAAIAHLKVAG